MRFGETQESLRDMSRACSVQLTLMPWSACFQGTKDFMSGMGLGMITEQLADLKLGELLDTPPPGLDEAVAIAKVIHHLLKFASGG